MKKINNRVRFLFLLTSILFIFSSCNNNIKTDDIYLGVIQTTQQKDISYISYYNKSLKYIGESKFEYADMGDSTRIPLVIKDNIYVVPLGLGNKKNLKIIMKLNLKTLKKEIFDIKQPATLMYSADNNDHIYTTNSLNQVGFITECNIKNGTINSSFKKNTVFWGTGRYDNLLYSWGTTNENNVDNPYMFIYKLNPLKLVKKVPLDFYDQYASIRVGDFIYFTNNYGRYEKSECNVLSKYSLATGKIVNIPLQASAPYQIFNYNNKLYITHCHPISNEGNKITVLDLKNNVQKLYTLESSSSLMQCSISGKYLFNCDGTYLYKYDLNNNFSLENKVNVFKSRKSKLIFYLGGFFIR